MHKLNKALYAGPLIQIAAVISGRGLSESQKGASLSPHLLEYHKLILRHCTLVDFIFIPVGRVKRGLMLGTGVLEVRLNQGALGGQEMAGLQSRIGKCAAIAELSCHTGAPKSHIN